VKLDSGFRRNDDGETRHGRARPAHLPLHEMAGSSPAMTIFQYVITGLDPVISSTLDKMAGSSPAMTIL
jgi:hypothetical protein